MAFIGIPLACLGMAFNILPYHLCKLIVKHIIKYDRTLAGTYKVIYSLFLFPVFFIIEAMIIYVWFGWVATTTFAILIVPLSYFTLFFLEWASKGGLGSPIPLLNLRKTISQSFSKQLIKQRTDIKDLVDELAAHVDQHAENKS